MSSNRVEPNENNMAPEPNDNKMAPKPTSFTYAVKKTIAEGLLDIAMLMANASQLNVLLNVPPGAQNGLFFAMLVFIGFSVLMQVTVAVLLLILGFREAKKDDERSDKMNNSATGLVLFITIFNIFISAFFIKFSDDGAP